MKAKKSQKKKKEIFSEHTHKMQHATDKKKTKKHRLYYSYLNCNYLT